MRIITRLKDGLFLYSKELDNTRNYQYHIFYQIDNIYFNLLLSIMFSITAVVIWRYIIYFFLHTSELMSILTIFLTLKHEQKLRKASTTEAQHSKIT